MFFEKHEHYPPCSTEEVNFFFLKKEKEKEKVEGNIEFNLLF